MKKKVYKIDTNRAYIDKVPESVRQFRRDKALKYYYDNRQKILERSQERRNLKAAGMNTMRYYDVVPHSPALQKLMKSPLYDKTQPPVVTVVKYKHTRPKFSNAISMIIWRNIKELYWEATSNAHTLPTNKESFSVF